MKQILAAGLVVLMAGPVLAGGHRIQAALPGADTGGVLAQEPPRGALPPGVTVLVDDHTCPAGQIKQVTGGSKRAGTSRTSECVAR